MVTGKIVFPENRRLVAQPIGKFSSVAEMPVTNAEVAFLGRSNSGKSSLLRALLQTDKPPQISSRPGSTRLIQLYQLGSDKEDSGRLTLGDRLQLTEIDAAFEGDTHFPAIDARTWRETARETHQDGAGFAYAFVTYERS